MHVLNSLPILIKCIALATLAHGVAALAQVLSQRRQFTSAWAGFIIIRFKYFHTIYTIGT